MLGVKPSQREQGGSGILKRGLCTEELKVPSVQIACLGETRGRISGLGPIHPAVFTNAVAEALMRPLGGSAGLGEGRQLRQSPRA